MAQIKRIKCLHRLVLPGWSNVVKGQTYHRFCLLCATMFPNRHGRCAVVTELAIGVQKKQE